MRDAKGRFGPGNPGRQVGSRNKLEQSVTDAFLKDFDQYGSEAIVRVREADPTGYLRVAASLLPKQSNRTITHDVANLSDAEILNLIKDVRDNLGPASGAGRDGTPDKGTSRLN